MSEDRLTEDQVAGAFRDLFKKPEPQPLPEPVAVAQPAEEPVAPAAAPAASTEPAESDELAALRAELASTRTKASESLDWARKGFLRTSNEATRAKAYLKQALENPDGVSKEEVARFLAGEAAGVAVQSPLSVYGPPVAAPQPPPDERLYMDTSQFLLDYGLDESKAQSFMTWLSSDKATVTERDIVPGDHYSTLRHGYEKWQAATHTPDPAVAAAAASVARVQREVAKSAGAPSRVMPTPEPEPVDFSKLTPEQRAPLVERAFEELARQYTNR